MSERHHPGPTDRDEPASSPTVVGYEIRVAGRLSPTWSEWFGPMTIETADGVTTIRGPVADQAALHGVLQRLRDVGLPLLELTPITTDYPTEWDLPLFDKEH